MPTITGTAHDVGTNPLGTSDVARMHFRIEHASRDINGGLHFRKERVVATAADGTFTVVLPEYVTHPRPLNVWIGVSWLVPDGYEPGGGYTATDWYPEPFHVPRSGGNLGDLIGKQIGNDLVYSGLDAVNLGEQTGLQYNPATGDLYQWKA